GASRGPRRRGRDDGVRRALCDDRGARIGVRRAVSPREVLNAWAANARELSGRVRGPVGRRAAYVDRTRMILLPAIDIRGGHAVRLEMGAFDSEKVYDDDPLDAARRWVAAGARALHVVDLD